MTSIALFGAGGKMGYRLASNLKGSRFEVRHVEVGHAGRDRLKAGLAVECVAPDEALEGAEVVVLAVPDMLIGKVASQVVPSLKPGTMVVILDAAAPFAGHLPERSDITYFVTHPCHPPIFNDETEMAAKKDYFGGVAAKQHIVSALMQGPESAYALGEEVAKVIWAPVMRSHRVTVEQMALLEPGLSETVCATLLDVMREAMDEVVAPRRAARGRPRLPSRPHERPRRRHLQGGRRGLLRCLQQGDRVRQAGPDAAATGRRSSNLRRSPKASAASPEPADPTAPPRNEGPNDYNGRNEP